MKPKPHRRWPKSKRAVQPWHPAGLSQEQLTHHTSKQRPPGAVTASELERDVLAFLVERYGDRHLDIEVAQLGLSNAAHKLIEARLRSVAGSAEVPLLVPAG